MSGCLPLGVTGILPVILFALTGMMTTAELTDIFFFNALWLLLGSLLIAIAIQVTNLHRRIALKILLFVGTRPRRYECPVLKSYRTHSVPSIAV